MKLIALILILLTSCGVCDKRENSPKPSPAELLEAKYNRYLELIKDVQDGSGFIETIRCDSLLLSALSGTGGAPVELRSARNSEGQWFRRPLNYPECYANGESKSTISRDMILGVMWYAWARQDLEIAQSLYDYATDHNLVMGQGVPSRTILSPMFYGTLALIVDKLGGESSKTIRKIPALFDNNLSGYEIHLQELHLALRAEILGGASDKELASFKQYSEKDPKNPLLQAIYHKYSDGNQSKAISLLLSDYWPQGRLPTSRDRCDEWVVSQDRGKNWEPCKSKKKETYSGGELLFIYYFIQAKS